MPDVYRRAASVMLLRPVGESHEVLFLHKPRKNDAWQLPQGGVEGEETTKEAALRELQEEAGIGSCTLLGESRHAYKYDFPPSFRRFRPDNVCGQCIAFVFAIAAPDTVVTVDCKEVDAFAWVDSSQFTRYVHRKEYVDLLASLYAEAQELLSRRAS